MTTEYEPVVFELIADPDGVYRLRRELLPILLKWEERGVWFEVFTRNPYAQTGEDVYSNLAGGTRDLWRAWMGDRLEIVD